LVDRQQLEGYADEKRGMETARTSSVAREMGAGKKGPMDREVTF